VSTEFDGYMRELWPKTCEVCEDTFYVPKYRLAKRKTCSTQCRTLFLSKKARVSCAWCSESFEVQAKRVKKSKSGLVFCTRTCKDQAQRADGLEEIRPLKTDIADYRDKALRAKDRACERCDYKEEVKMLDVHHIDGDRENNELENLEILCVWCHALDTRRVDRHGWNGKIVE
jgi:hypothetical protein